MTDEQPDYHEIVTTLRQAFPQPVSDRVHDAYFVFSILRALDQVDGMKSDRPLLGSPSTPDFAQARLQRVLEQPQSLESVSQQMVEYLQGMLIWGHPKSQINVVPPPTIPSIIGGLLPSLYNPNLVSEESSRKVAQAEVEAIAMTADLIGYDAQTAGGLFTFGGTATILYGIKIALEKIFPDAGRRGLRERSVIICSDQAHYACRTVANWLGMGDDNVIEIPSTADNEMRTCLVEDAIRNVYRDGDHVAAIVATMGTTDAFGIDDIVALREICDDAESQYQLDRPIHLHADAVIGWAWSVFNNYDFDANPLKFRGRTVRALAHSSRRIRRLSVADTLGIDYHKTGFAPYTSSAVLCRDAGDLQRIARDPATMPYLFQSGTYHPGQYSLETTRSGSGPMAALANLKLFGRSGLQALIGHLVSMAETLREQLESHAATTVLNRGNFGPVTLFRVYPDGVDTFTFPERERRDPACRADLENFNQYNREIFDRIQTEALEGRGVVISLTECYRESDYGVPIVALKSYILSPFSDENYVHAVLESLREARKFLQSMES